jgi:hypothetical protein
MRNALLLATLLAAACGSSSTPAPVEPTPTEPTPTEPTPTEPTPTEPTPTEPAKPPEPPKPPEPTSRHVRPADVKWMPFDPNAAEPDKGPQMGVVFGDPQSGPSGLFIKAPAKHVSPPHVHSADYKGVVISGTVTNDVPKAKKPVKMTAGSFWAEAGGRAHVTACPDGCLAFVTVDGAFDMLGPDKAGASPTGMKPVNTLPKSLKWVAPPGTKDIWFAQAWGDPQSGEPHGFFVKIKAGNPGMMHSHTSDYHAVVIQGSPKHWEPGQTPEASPPGSYWWQKGGADHQDSCDPGQDCIGYVHMLGKMDFAPGKAP